MLEIAKFYMRRDVESDIGKVFSVSSAHDIFGEKTKVGCQRLEKFSSPELNTKRA